MSKSTRPMKFTIALLSDAAHERFCHMLYYPVRLLTAGLVDLGHDVLVTHNSVSPEEDGRFNILVGAHHLTAPKDVERLLGSIGPYAVLQTEWIADGVLHGRGSRQAFEATYQRILRGANVVWEWVDERNNQEGLPTVQLRPGYHEALVDIKHRAWEDKDIDCVFFGSVTPYRRRLLDAVAKRGLKVAVLGLEHMPIRNDALARSKVVLAPRYEEGLDYRAEARMCYAHTNGFKVIVDHGKGAEAFADMAERVRRMDGPCRKTAAYKTSPRFVDLLNDAMWRS